MASSEARMVRLEPGESLARYASTGFSSRGRPAVGIADGTSMAATACASLPAGASQAVGVAIVASGSSSVTLRPPALFGSEKRHSHNLKLSRKRGYESSAIGCVAAYQSRLT